MSSLFYVKHQQNITILFCMKIDNTGQTHHTQLPVYHLP